jgi:hypothetical protein
MRAFIPTVPQFVNAWLVVGLVLGVACLLSLVYVLVDAAISPEDEQ